LTNPKLLKLETKGRYWDWLVFHFLNELTSTMDYCLRKTEDEEWHSKYLVQLNTQSGH